MLKMEAEQGIQHVIATPHFYPKHDSPEHFLERRHRAEAKLLEVLEENPGLPKVSFGAEVYYFRGISNSKAILELTIHNKSSILIEMPQIEWTESMYHDLEMIYTNFGLTPIVAHIDRYIRPFHARRVLRRLADLPVLVQANAEFFLNKATAGMALRMLKNDQIQFLGSDCHNMTDRKPNLGDAIELIQERADRHVLDRVGQYQQSILAD